MKSKVNAAWVLIVSSLVFASINSCLIDPLPSGNGDTSVAGASAAGSDTEGGSRAGSAGEASGVGGSENAGGSTATVGGTGASAGAAPGPVCEAVPLLAPQLGHAALTSDFDKDGKADLVLGDPADSAVGGKVCVYYGKTFQSGKFAGACKLIHQDVPGMNIDGVNEPEDQFGAALAAGDFDGDGVSDLAIGAPGEVLDATNSETGAVEKRANAGRVGFFFGKQAEGLAEGRTPTQWLQNGVPDIGIETGDRTGEAIFAFNLDSDSGVEIAIGAPGETPATASKVANAGAVFLASVQTTPDQPRSGFSISQRRYTTGDFPFRDRDGLAHENDLMGSSVHISALQGGVLADSANAVILIGKPGEDEGRGAVHAWFVSTEKGFEAPVKKAVLFVETLEPNALFGKAIASDGRYVYVGAPGASSGMGRIYRFDLMALPSMGTWPSVAVEHPDAVPGVGAFGWSLQIVKDGASSTLLVGAPGTFGTACNEGRVYVFDSALKLTATESLAGSNLFGYALAAGDLNGDGKIERIATAPASGIYKVW